MMTNREKFRDELDNLLARIIAVVDGEPVRCWSASCKRCFFQDTCGKPRHKKKIIDWLNAEYQEPPVDWSTTNEEYISPEFVRLAEGNE